MTRALTAGWVVPVDAPPIRDGAVLLDGERIAWVGPAADLPAVDDVEALGEAVLLPGLVNAHSHLELTAMRGFLEDLPFRDWIRTLTRASTAVLDAEDLAAASLAGIVEGLAAGVTTFADTSPTGAPLAAMGAAGVRGIVYREVFGPAPEAADGAVAALAAQVAALRDAAPALVEVGVSPHAPYSVSPALFRATAALARREGLPLAVHIAESVDEVHLVTAGEGRWAEFLRGRGIAVAPLARSPIALLEASGVLEGRTLLIHVIHANDADRRAIAQAGATVVHCPASNAKLGHGIAPLPELLALDVPVGLGSDSVASNNQMDLLTEARLAVLLQGARLARPDALSARDALHLATLGGARALGLDHRTGSLTPGKAADLAAFALEEPRAVPAYAPESALVFALAGARARDVWVAGRRLVREGRVTVPHAAALARCQAAAARLAAWREAGAPG